MRVAELLDAWLAELATKRKPTTVLHYRKRIAVLRPLVDRELGTVTHHEIQTELDRAAVGKAPDTIRSNSVSVQQWGKWLVRRGHLEALWPIEWTKPRGREREVLPTSEELQALVKLATPAFVRIFRALRLTGARPGELCRATIANIDRRAGLIVIADHKTAAKTGKPRKIATGHPALLAILDECIGDRTEGHIFLSDRGRPWTVPNLSRIFRDLRDRAGLAKELVLYTTRHEHATQIYAATGQLSAVADALGHGSLQTSRRYAKVSAEQLAERQQLFRENLGSEK